LRKVVEEQLDLHRAHRHGQRDHLAQFLLGRPRLPRN
jgi:hypothetical protein